MKFYPYEKRGAQNLSMLKGEGGAPLNLLLQNKSEKKYSSIS